MLSGIPDDSIDCIWTDPPYLLSNGGITCVAGKMVSVDKGDWDKSKGIEADYEFNEAWTKECYRVLKPTGTIWVSGTLHIYPSIGMALLRNGFRLLNDIIWEKPNPPPNLGRRTFTHSTEIILWASKAPRGSRHKYQFNYDEMRSENGGKQMKTVWRFTTAGKKEKQFGKHPTQKPVALIDRCIRASTHPGDTVLDPFAGTASTGVAALGVDHRFIGIEVDESFAEIGENRLSQITPPHCLSRNKYIFIHTGDRSSYFKTVGEGELGHGAAQHSHRRRYGTNGSSSSGNGWVQSSTERKHRLTLWSQSAYCRYAG